MGCYGVQLTRHGGERVQGRAAEGEKDGLAIREFGKLVIVEDRELGRGEVKMLACLADEVTNVEVGLAEDWRRGLS